MKKKNLLRSVIPFLFVLTCLLNKHVTVIALLHHAANLNSYVREKRVKEKKEAKVHSQFKNGESTVLFSQWTRERILPDVLWILTCSLVLRCIYPKGMGSLHLHMWCVRAVARNLCLAAELAHYPKMMSEPWRSPSVHIYRTHSHNVFFFFFFETLVFPLSCLFVLILKPFFLWRGFK